MKKKLPIGISEGAVEPLNPNAKKAKSFNFPVQEYDWKDIKCRIYPLVVNVIKRSG